MALGTEASQERKGDSEKFVMATPTTSPTDQVKVVVTLSGDVISHADINLKLPRPGGNCIIMNLKAFCTEKPMKQNVFSKVSL